MDSIHPVNKYSMKSSAWLVSASLLMFSAGICSAQQTSEVSSGDSGWHLDLSLYLWFAGAHGTVGARRRDFTIQASPGDLLSHFNSGFMGAAEARYKRFVLNGNLQWIRLSDKRGLPVNQLGVSSADVLLGQLVWTSKVGYRVIDNEKVKTDAHVGVRFWHLGEKIQFESGSARFESQRLAEVG